jgi:hypothetical protein
MFPSSPDAPSAAAGPSGTDRSAPVPIRPSWRRDAFATVLVVTLSVLLWVPRWRGPIDMRWDGAVYFILGTSLAEGKGYKLLNEPGDIDEVHYPPLLPAIVAGHQLLLGSNDPTTVGRWLRLTSFLLFVAYTVVVFRFLRTWLQAEYAVLGTMLSLFCMHAWFLSDVLFPEIWFGIATLTFLLSASREGSRVHAVLAWVAAVAGYALRTAGVVAFAAWVVDSLLRRRFRQAALRAAFSLVPVASWQMYVASVERSPEYIHPAYEYQRAPYNFYNVSYAKNIELRDPFTPEKGPVLLERRVIRNALHIPVNLGETFTASPQYFETWLGGVVGSGPVTRQVVHWSVFAAMSLFGGVLVLGGLGRQLLAGQTLVPVYVLGYFTALCFTPFPEQYRRYLMPIAAPLAMSAVVFLSSFDTGRGSQSSRPKVHKLPLVVLGVAWLMQVASAVAVYRWRYETIEYVDRAGKPVAYRLFYYDQTTEEFDRAVDYVRGDARARDVVAAGMPHWVHLRTGLKTVMPPFEADPARAQALLDSVPVRYLLIGADMVESERYTLPVVRQFPDRWRRVHSTRTGSWAVYRRVD